MNKKTFVYNIFLLLFFSIWGCYPQKAWRYPEDLNWQKEIAPLAREIAVYLKHHQPPNAELILTDFVYLDDLKPHKLGPLLRNLLEAELSQRGIKIREVELARYFRLGPHGFTLMTRNINEVRQTEITDNIPYAVIGTYEISGGYVYLICRVFNLKNDVTEKVFNRTISLATWQLRDYP